MQGLIAGSMPLVIGAVLYFLQPSMFRPFLHSMAGVGVIAGIAVLLTLGALSIRKIIRIDV